jgi:hypothetical protein
MQTGEPLIRINNKVSHVCIIKHNDNTLSTNSSFNAEVNDRYNLCSHARKEEVKHNIRMKKFLKKSESLKESMNLSTPLKPLMLEDEFRIFCKSQKNT